MTTRITSTIALFVYICLLFVMAQSTVSAQSKSSSQNPNPIESVYLDLNQDTTSSGLCVNVSLINNSKVLVYSSSFGFLKGYNIGVTDYWGNKVPYTLYGKLISEQYKRIFTEINFSVPPGGKYSSSFNIGRMYDMTKPGNYHVVLSRVVSTTSPLLPQVFNSIKSNDLEIRVSPSTTSSLLIKNIDRDTIDTGYGYGLLKDGDEWRALIEIFKAPSSIKEEYGVTLDNHLGISPGYPYVVFDTYMMTIKVSDTYKDDDRNKIFIQFTPKENSPSYVQGRSVQVVVNRTTNQLEDVNSENVRTGDVVDKIDNKSVLVRPINGYAVGFPCDIIPFISLPKGSSSTQLISPDKTTVLSVSKTEVGEDEMWSEKLTVRDKDWFRVTQKWSKGQKWWTQYIKEDFDSQVGMRATTVASSEVNYGATINGLALGLGSEDALTMGGEPVHLRVALKNTLDKDVTLKPVLMNGNLNLTVIDVAHRAVPLTIAGKEASAQPALLFDKQVLPAHSTIYRDLLLSRDYDLSLGGIYSVSASASQVAEGTDSKLASPSLNVRVMG